MITTTGILIFGLCTFLLGYTYVLYPLLLRVFASGKQPNPIRYQSVDDPELPEVNVVFSAYNEEKVIAEKLASIFNTSYPAAKLQVWLGSDNSTDRTNAIAAQYAEQYPSLHFTVFSGRNGKSRILNLLVEQVLEHSAGAPRSIFILTDANVMFTPNLIFHLVRHFKNEAIGQVAANIQNRGVREDGISFQEETYIQRENSIKYLEGLNWGTMMGAFGACYALRAACWSRIPPHTLMEDFYLSMHVLQHRYRAIKEMEAVCYEDVSNDVSEEFKRKTRIQAGNFQNLKVYWRLLFRFDATAFCFLSHKVLRWFGPVWIVGAWLSNLLLLYTIPSSSGLLQLLLVSFVLQSFLLVTPVLEKVLRNFGVHLKLLRFAAYFYLMNIALVKGFWTYLKGIKTSAWNPTKRNLT